MSQQSSRSSSRWLTLAAVLVLGFILGGVFDGIVMHQAWKRHHEAQVEQWRALHEKAMRKHPQLPEHHPRLQEPVGGSVRIGTPPGPVRSPAVRRQL